MSKSFNIALISIGDELCIGQTLNTNAYWIAKELVKLGANVYSHITIKDEEQEICRTIFYLKNNSDLIICTGGLGPTHDDITKNVLTKYFDDELTLHNETLDYLKTYFAQRQRPFLEMHNSQAMMPSKAKLFPNKIGTAQGMLFYGEDFELFSMPGVPREMKYIMEYSFLDYVKSKIDENKNNILVYRTLRTIGITESVLAELIGDVSFLKGNSLAFLPSYSGVKLRLGTESNSYENAYKILDELEDYLNSRCGKYIYSNQDEELENFLAIILLNNNIKISGAESCTGGLFGAKMTSLSGSSNYFLGSAVTYSNQAKIDILGVSANTLQMFGAVSEECAKEMALGSILKYKSDYAISITGIAGPDGGTDEKPVGLVWIGIASKNNVEAYKFIFGKDRETNRELSVYSAINLLIKAIKEQK